VFTTNYCYMKTTIELDKRHKEIAENNGLNLSKFVRKQLEGLQNE